MTARQPDILVPRDSEDRMLWAIMLSAVVHSAAIVAFVIVPRFLPERSTPSVSYTVDLVASAEPAGTNLPSGGKRKQPPAAAAPPVAPAPPPAPIEPPKPAEKPAEMNPVQEPVKPQEVPPPAPPQPKADVAPPPEKPVVKPPPVAEPKPAEVKLKAETVQKAEVKLDDKKQAQPTVKAKPPEPTRVVARATVAPAPSKKAVAAAQPQATPVANGAQAREQQIAAAIQRRVQDQRIADAVQRRAEAAAHQGSGPAGAEGTARGGPISIGQGTGSGGVVEGLEMILYRGQMERKIKENWVWAGDDASLEVKVYFDITESGQIQNVRVTGPSGNASYDASAARAVRAASPLASPPEKYRDLFTHGVEMTFRAQDVQS